MSASALLASTIVATFGLAGLALSHPEEDIRSWPRFWQRVVWLFLGINYLIWRWS